MKKTFAKRGLVLFASATLISTMALAADKAAAPKSDPKMEETMKKVEELGSPSAGHKALADLVGSWNAEVKCWMSPEAPPSINKGKAKTRWAMEGRFVQEDFSGEFMGKPFKGMSLTGYDNAKQKFNSIWVDDMHTSIFTSEGVGTEGNKIITLEGKMDCPITGQKDVVMRQVLRIVSRDKHVLEMHDTSKGAHSKTMEITYTRR